MAAISEDVALLARGHRHFSASLYKEVYHTNDNVVLCPISICAALSMLGVGAKGETAAQLAQALKVSSIEANSVVHEAFKQLKTAVLISDNPVNVAVIVGNTTYMPIGISTLDAFSKTLIDKYLVSMQFADFKNKKYETANEINGWIASHTDNKIKSMVSPDMFDESTQLVVINAVYMRGFWDIPFHRRLISAQPFKLLDGSERYVDMMFQRGSFRVGYSDNLQCRILEKLYLGLDFSFDIILPNSIAAFTRLEGSLDVETIETLLNSFGEEIGIYFWLPRFQAEVLLSLHEVLPKLGIVDMFSSEKANFSGITNEKLCVSKVLHKTFIVVDDAGSESSPGSGVPALTSWDDAEKFRVDHPFLYWIRHVNTGEIIIIGRVTSPPKST